SSTQTEPLTDDAGESRWLDATKYWQNAPGYQLFGSTFGLGCGPPSTAAQCCGARWVREQKLAREDRSNRTRNDQRTQRTCENLQNGSGDARSIDKGRIEVRP